MPKSFRPMEIAEKVIEGTRGFEVERLDLNRLTPEFGQNIILARPCVPTAMPVRRWPRSCPVALDADRAFQEETRNAARALVAAARPMRRGRRPKPDSGLVDPRPK